MFVLSKENDSGEFYNTFEGVNFCFDDDFGNYDENEGYDDFVESLEKKDADLTKEEFDLLKEYLTNLIEDVVSFEADEYDSDFADSDIEDAIQNKRFVIVISTNSLL